MSRESIHVYAKLPTTAVGQQTMDTVLRLQRAEQVEIERARKATGLTSKEFTAVRYLLQAERDDRPVGPKALALMLRVSNASVTKMVDRLVSGGYVRRVPHPTDRRATVLRTVDGAAQRVHDAYTRFHTTIVETIDKIPDSEATVLAQRLGEIVTALDSTNPTEDDDDSYYA